MQVDRLRLIGFKSFVEAAELEVRPGLTGIVGPNGCGKSNLAEALRWAMGESSARRLRGGEMDDLIFAGTAGRPAGNIAEVALTLDNSARTAPRAFNDRDEIEIVRRIERGGRSVFRIDGLEVRARDVQLLFADAATGGYFGTVIGQGRVGALIEAKPAERRLLLEEAAGTAGHQLRRREALSRLAATEANLARLDDVLGALAAQLETVKRQARQAHRYRRLVEEVRRHEVLLFRARRRAAEAGAARAEAEFAAIEAAVAEQAAAAAAAQQRRVTAETVLPTLRLAESATAVELQRQIEARAGLEHELQRVLAARGNAERRVAQLAADLERENGQLADARAALDRLSTERDGLAGAAAPALEREAAALRLAAMSERLATAESEWRLAAEADAQAAARRAAIERRRRELDERRSHFEASRADTALERAALARDDVSRAAANAAAAVTEAEGRAEDAGRAVESAERVAAARQSRVAAALEARQRSAAQHARLAAEAEALKAVLAPPAEACGAVPILASLQVAAGFEAALGALLDDELTAPLGADTGAACCWVDLPAIIPAATLPEGAHALASVVTAPSALGRRLAQSGWVEDEATGQRLQRRLLPGQRLVDGEGRLWRWDGFTRNAPSRSAAARHLEQQQRLAVLVGEIAQSEIELRSAEAAAAAARADRDQAAEALRLAQNRQRETAAEFAAARATEATLARQALSAESRLAALDEAAARLAADLAAVAAAVEESERDLASLPAPAVLRTILEKARAAASEARRDEAEARGAVERLTQAAEARRERLAALDLDEHSWRRRAEAAAVQRAALVERQDELAREIAALASRPAGIAAESDALGSGIAAAAAAARQAADALARGEAGLREAAEHSQAADRALAEAREQRARLDALHDGAIEALARLDRDITERLGDAPETRAELADRGDGAEREDDQAEIARRLDRLLRERDGIGPVNLVAEREAAEIGVRVEALQRERADLTEAIAKLRHGVTTLDREARQRLKEAFERVGRHFEELFVRLFGGGRARLELTEEGDALTSGLEIMASPTGKRLQSLSLLSGGEQALTALALVFAVFLANPAPICVLDEVDAPLDDANVERLCHLVAEMAETTGTRFLLVTHHRITMARSDRLYGVTMVEPGISRLVSVELAAAARLRQTA
jgi:chromosome segregation protein